METTRKDRRVAINKQRKDQSRRHKSPTHLYMHMYLGCLERLSIDWMTKKNTTREHS